MGYDFPELIYRSGGYSEEWKRALTRYLQRTTIYDAWDFNMKYGMKENFSDHFESQATAESFEERWRLLVWQLHHIDKTISKETLEFHGAVS